MGERHVTRSVFFIARDQRKETKLCMSRLLCWASMEIKTLAGPAIEHILLGRQCGKIARVDDWS